jgi:putative DNA primase/helicase
MLTRISCKPFTKDAEIVSLDKVIQHDIEWLWPNHIPLGMLTLIAGDPGVGKSFLTLYIAAAVSAGLPWPDPECITSGNIVVEKENYKINSAASAFSAVKGSQSGSVLILNNEDTTTKIMCPRLSAMNADLSKIKLIPFVWRNDGNGHDYTAHFNIVTDMFALENALRGFPDTKLIIIDPLMSFFGFRDTYRDSHVRASLFPLINLASKYHVAVVCVIHLNKGSSNKIFSRIMGSLAFSSSARTVWFVHSLPNLENKKKSLLSPAKNNIVENPQALAFEMKDNRIVFDEHPFDTSAQDVLSPCRAGFTPPFSRRRSALSAVEGNGGASASIESPQLNRAVDWLKKLLADGNPLPSKSIFSLAEKSGFSNWILQKAKKNLQIKCFPEKDENGKAYWSWKLPILTKNVCNNAKVA